MIGKKINIVTLGCSKNVVDSEKLLKQLNAGGYEVFYNAENSKAQTVIINTCGFINDAKEESIDTILRYVKAQKSGQIDNLYVMGCLSERYAEALRLEIPEVKNTLGVINIQNVLDDLVIKSRKDHLTR